MSRTPNMPVAARRNLAAADVLPETRYHVAGYLYGLAAECAVKAMMEELGIRSKSTDRRSDPYYQHFPVLLSASRDAASGRRSGTLTRILNQPNFMTGWSTDIRYSATGDVTPAEVKRWKSQAKQAVASIGT